MSVSQCGVFLLSGQQKPNGQQQQQLIQHRQMQQSQHTALAPTWCVVGLPTTILETRAPLIKKINGIKTKTTKKPRTNSTDLEKQRHPNNCHNPTALSGSCSKKKSSSTSENDARCGHYDELCSACSFAPFCVVVSFLSVAVQSWQMSSP